MTVNQEVIDCGWNIDAVCFSFSNWTASIIPKPVLGWFPDPVRCMLMRADGIAEQEGLVRITTRDAFGDGGVEVAYQVPILLGQDAASILPLLADQINADGGEASIDSDGWLSVRHLGAEPPQSDMDGSSGPLIIEMGALGIPSVEISLIAKLARGPLSPCNTVDYAEPFGVLDFFDVSGFLAAYLAGSGEADLVYDGVLDFFDVSVFLQRFNQGCPGLGKGI